MTNITEANEDIHEVAARLKLSAEEVDDMLKLGASADDLKAIEAELTPLHADLTPLGAAPRKRKWQWRGFSAPSYRANKRTANWTRCISAS